MSQGLKESLYAQVGRLAKSMANAKRLELVELLCQAPKSVEALATEAGISVTLTSAHLKELRLAHVVESEKNGRQVIYRIACPEVAGLLVAMRALAQDRLADLRHTLQEKTGNAAWENQSESSLAEQARQGTVIVVDVRPADEFNARHLPHAVSIPLAELPQHLRSLRRKKPVVVYGRGPFCTMAEQAVEQLREGGLDAWAWREGAADWIADDAAADAAITAAASASPARTTSARAAKPTVATSTTRNSRSKPGAKK